MNINLAVKTENITKTFLSREVLKDCNIHVEKGTIYGFLGANGAGKTTLFKIISGLLTPTMGNAQVLGMSVTSERNKILSEIGTIIETNSDIASVLSSVGLNNINEQPVSTFSLGMRQRLAIARAIIHKPKLLILDEPINGLDPVGIKEIRDLFIELVKNQNMTLLISSHILTEIEHIADTIGVIVNGTIVKEVSMTKIKAECPSGLEDYFIDIMNGGENK